MEYIIDIKIPDELISNAVEFGQNVIKKIKEFASDDIYNSDKKLTFYWGNKKDFDAFASSKDETSDEINISYGVTIDIMHNAINFSNEWSSNGLNHYKKVFCEEQENESHFIPNELTPQESYVPYFENSLSWLYLHEQAHLSQCHGTIYSEFSDRSEENNIIEWHESQENNDNNHQKFSSRDASIKHVCELSADNEATYLIIEFLKKDGTIKCSTLWNLCAGLNYLFFYFHGKQNKYHEGKIFGTHPNPTVRMRFLYFQLIEIFEKPNMKEYFEEGKTFQDYEKAVKYSLIVSLIYYEEKYNSLEGVSEFMNLFFDVESKDSKEYIDIISAMWNKIRPSVVSKYFGKNSDGILPEF